jgi:hypothetical protein
MNRLFLSLGLLVLVPLPAPALEKASWAPKKAPLMTRWAKDVKPERPLPEYPRPQMQRGKWLNLNGVWQFAFAKDKEAPPVGKDLPETILVPFPVESALSGVMKTAERLWYRRTFTVPADWAGQRILLHFGGVDWEAVVYVNGKLIGSHRGGYDAFYFDITDALKAKGPQELILGVYDPTDAGYQPRGKQVRKPGGIYYTPTTGIWQTVWLEPVPATHITRLKIVPDVDSKTVRVNVTTSDKASVRLTARAGSEVVSTVTGRNDEVLTLPIAAPKLWWPESPFLYDLTVEVRKGATTLDKVESYFGMRKIEVKAEGKGPARILLNGKAVFQVGPLDQGFWPDGLYTAPTDAALKYDIEITKKFGFNMTRKHVKVEPARWYYWCDKLGLLVWQDMPSGDRSVPERKPDLVRTPESARQYELELKRMIDGLHNHPCVVMWVVFNEGWGQFDTARITAWTKKYDPTRLVNCASGWNDRNVGDVHDIHVYPGPGAPPLSSKRAGVLGEFGGLGLGVDGHTWTKKTWGYRGATSKADLTRKYERLLEATWKLHQERGLCAAVYTQITDVESEANGLLTYDRAVIKVELERIAAVNRGDFSRVPIVETVVPTSQKEGQRWRYTLKRPGKEWFKADFDDSKWKEGTGGFGTKGTPGAVVRTVWKTNDIWVRRTFELAKGPFDDLLLQVHHDEDAKVYLNGVLALETKGYITDYQEFPIRPEAKAALRPGKNVIAIHCKQTGGGQYIDAGLIRLKARAKR